MANVKDGLADTGKYLLPPVRTRSPVKKPQTSKMTATITTETGVIERKTEISISAQGTMFFNAQQVHTAVVHPAVTEGSTVRHVAKYYKMFMTSTSKLAASKTSILEQFSAFQDGSHPTSQSGDVHCPMISPRSTAGERSGIDCASEVMQKFINAAYTAAAKKLS